MGLANDNERSVLTTFLQREYDDLEVKLKADESCTILSYNSMTDGAHTDFLSDLLDLPPGGRAAPATLSLLRLAYLERLSHGPFPLVARNHLFS